MTPAKQGIEESPGPLIFAKKAKITPLDAPLNTGGADRRTLTLEAWEDKTLSTIFRVTIKVRLKMLAPVLYSFLTTPA